MRRVVITGIGSVSPFGVGRDALWDGIVHGRSGIRRITRFDPERFPSQIAGEVPDFDPTAHLPRRDVVRTDAFIHYALIASAEALRDAGFKVEGQADRTGVSIGTGMGGIPLLMASYDLLLKEGPGSVSPYAMPGFLPNMAAGWVSMRTGARGPIASATTACAAGSQAIGDAFRMVRHGDADAMLAGGTDALIHPVVVASFCGLRALSTAWNGEPTRASRPFDLRRDGFVLAEGSVVLLLETLDGARARGARAYAEVAGYGLTADAHHPTAPSTDGPARAIRLALRDAALRPEDVDYVNAHGTSTPQNDVNETRTLKEVFGPHARRLAISSTKSMTGHLIGAAGAIGAAAAALAIHHGVVPPTINYETPDPECDLDYVPNAARRMTVQTAIANSFAFGGANAILALRRVEESGPAAA